MRYWNPVWISKETTKDDRTTRFISLRHDANEPDLLRTRYVYEESKSLIKICVRAFLRWMRKSRFFLRNDLSEKSLNMSSLRLTLSLPEHLWCLVTMVTCNAPTIDSIGEVGWSQRSLRVDNILSLILRHNSTYDHCCCDQCGKKAISRQIQLLCNWNCSQTDEENASLRFH